MANVSKIKRSLPKFNRGQTTVEYILLAAVIVSVGMGAYSLFKTKLIKPLTDVKKGFEGNASRPAAGSGGKAEDQYYKNVEFKKK